jgi:N-acetylneuraminate synthase/N,N'-diacetyllegionaminate synthase
MSKRILLIAEVGHNGNGNMRLNHLMIDEAKSCGADIVKFQLYDTDKIKKPWQSRYLELKFAELTYEDCKELKDHCDRIGIEFMASAFDAEKVKWLEKLGVKRHKLASRSINDKEVIKAMEKTGKPIIASLGYWDKKELPKIKNAEFLFCISEYPTYFTNETFPTKFDKYAGFSDHSIGCYWAREAIKRGATIIEKHFTLSHELPGFNQKGSMEPWEMKELKTYIKQAERGITY